METAEILSLISTISYVLAAISFVIAVFFWFGFKIPSVIGDLSGRTARKSIARRRANNEKAGGRGYQPSATNVNRGRLTDTMQHSRKLAAETDKMPKSAAAQKDAGKKATGKKILGKKNPADSAMPETGVLTENRAEACDEQQTTMLGGTDTTGLLIDENATAPLHTEHAPAVKRTGGKKMKILDDVMLIHTDEVI